MNKKTMIKVKGLVKKFNKLKVVNNLSFEVNEGELFGFIGLNGAGKTTTLNIILGLLNKDGGEVYIEGDLLTNNIDKIRNKIGIVFQESVLDGELTVYENLVIRCSLYQDKVNNVKKTVDRIMNEFELNELKNRPYGKLSGGQKRRVDIARALVHNPRILFLDEPTTGLDPSSRKMVWEILKKLRKDHNLTILLTTHYMEEANDCDNIIIIKKGVKLIEGTPFELKSNYSTTILKIHEFDEASDIKTTINKVGAIRQDNYWLIKFMNFIDLKQFIDKYSTNLKDYEILKGSMDEVFLNVTKEKE
ncbi:ABC transporter ATP-binding protein [Mycoplasma zalophidermidis]|uniref:ABC transporter ATP-binding protein n=1 Tax=Mycoplasma zalophidermidis TaxID=398174 RepID=A0ABS6DR31_9MOLU|nr:ABC transporter ATP-binding protein [Mycoplasma zalophidermidis]MBU4693367.1 ABC transporter ATP-binding protein [Mycoplasma zalophidermidis]